MVSRDLNRWTAQKRAGCDGLRRSMAERSYPPPKVRGGGPMP